MKTFTYVQKYMQWRKWRKIASLWRFEWDAKSGPLEVAILAKMAILAKPAGGLAIIAINVPDPWRLAILTKMAIVAKLAILAKIARNACYGANGKKLPAFSLSSRTYLLEKRSPKSNQSRNVQQPASAILKCVKSLISPYVNFHEMSLLPNTSPH